MIWPSWRRITPGALLLLLAGCAAGTPSPRTAPDLPVMAVPDLENRAILLLLSDQKIYDPLSVRQVLRGGPELRAALALTLGRIPDPRSRTSLEGLLLDDDPRVRRAAAFALGVRKDRAAAPALLVAVAGADRETGVLAVEALGKLGARVTDVAEKLLPLPEAERWARLVPHLFRFKEDGKIPLAEHALALPDRELHARAAYALARDPFPEAAPLLRPLLADPDPQVRDWAARGLGDVGDASDLPRLRPLLDDAEPGPTIQALRAAERLIDGRKGGRPEAAPPPADWEPRLAALCADPRPGVRVTALEAAGSWKPSDRLGAVLVETATRGTGQGGVRARGTAVVALAKAGYPKAGELATQAAKAAEPDVRARAAEAAALLGAAALLQTLGEDKSPQVREAVLTSRLAAADAKAAAEVAHGGLADADAGVRATALDWLTAHPVLPIEVLRPALGDALHDSTIESGLSALKALVARAEAEARERGAITEILEKGATDLKYVLRREAMNGLARLGRPVSTLAPVEPDKPADAYREIVQRTSRPRRVEVRTSKGSLRLRLACPEAPLTCLNFLTLASQGFFDGLLFHRVVPDFVVQGGDPRGDGFGGPDYTIRDEINPLRYKRGMVGMALAGPDTGGSQFFITLSPQPYLDGGYTIFGEVEQGLDVLDRIEAGDRIEKVVELP
ncbi:MAG TPA: peptidylprolyl isomerase [Thermoanaerobaculia bacterium]|nr:peptidylprolyl isomerase [Thermoanaerobaculia bacterium]